MSYLIKISLRRLAREKGYAVVNILGLTVGMGSALIIFLFLRHETSYDNYHPHQSSTYRVATELNIHGHKQQYAVSSAALAPALTLAFPGIESYLRIFHPSYFLHDMVFYHKDKAFYEHDIFAVDSTFFSFFSCRFIWGNPDTALSKPFSIVFTSSLALEIFGRTDIVGQKLKLSDAGVFTITAVIEDNPSNTHFQYRGLVSLSSMEYMSDKFELSFGKGFRWNSFAQAYGSTVVWSYIKVNEQFSPSEFLANHWSAFYDQHIKKLIPQENFSMRPIFQPITSIHLDSDINYELSSERDIMRLMNKEMVKVFFTIGIFLLFLAAINYTNMAISHFNKKRKEMAMVKILGSKVGQLLAGFLTESFVIAAISMLGALVLVEFIVGWVNDFLQVNLSLYIFHDWHVVLIIAGVFLFTALLSGLFPAIYFIYTPPVKLLATRFNAGKYSLLLKRILVTIQFAIAVYMVASALVVYRQINYIQEMDLGYDVKDIFAIELHARESKERIAELENILQKDSSVMQTARSNYVFSMYPIKHTILFNTRDGYFVRSFNNIQTTLDYIHLMGVEIYDSADSTDFADGVLVNRALVDSIGYDSPVGESMITHYQFLEGKQRRTRTIRGVVDNFHYALLNKPVEPLVILPMNINYARYLVVKFFPGDSNLQKQVIEKAWKDYELINPLHFFPLSDNIDGFFEHNRNLSRFFGYLAWLCVLISFLGVFGVTAYNIEQRSVEIGIRKVLGANWADYFQMFFSNYFSLYIIGSLVGVLVCAITLHRWLATFAYSIDLDFVPFALAVFLVGIIVFTAIIIHIFRIMYMNPADSIRKE